MSLALFVYFAGIVNGLQNTLGLLASLSGIAVAVIIFVNFMTDSKYKWKLFLISGLVCGLFGTIIPDKNTVYLMGAAYAAEKAYDSEMGQDTVKLLHLKIKEQIKAIEQPTQPTKK